MTAKKEIHYGEMLTKVLQHKVPEGFKGNWIRDFYSYSFGNIMSAFLQCNARGISFGPIATYKKWQEHGRSVRKGEKAIGLIVPRPVKKKDAESDEDQFVFFATAWRFFVLSQTEGEEFDLQAQIETDFDFKACLEKFNIKQVEYAASDMTPKGLARKNKNEPGSYQLMLNPLYEDCLPTALHEIAHIALGHLDLDAKERNALGHSLMEVEAEATAYLCCCALGIDDDDILNDSAKYTQTYLKTTELADKTARKIFAACDRILRAGLNMEKTNVKKAA